MKRGTLELGIVENVLKIRGNLYRLCGNWERGGGFFNMAAIQTDNYWENEAKLT